MMKKLIAILALSLSLILCMTACGAKMPYDLSGTTSVELHAYNNDSTEPFAKIVVDGEDVATIVEMFNTLKLKEMKYTEPSFHGYDFWFKDADGNQIAKISLPYGPSPWVVVKGTAYQDVNGGVDVDYLAQLVDMAVSAGPASAPGSDDRGGRPYAPHIGSYVTKVDVTHILSGQLQEWTVDGEQLDALREWANGLEYEHRTYADGQSPGDTNGGEIYDFVLTEGDYPGFTYVINGPDDCHLVIEGEWFVVNNPSTPPITAP
jgi:hypothetical protein